jgi:hypothetical protein
MAAASNRSWRRARAIGRGVRKATVSNRGGERRRRKVGGIDKRGCAVSTGGSWIRLSAEGDGQLRAGGHECRGAAR